MSPDLVRVDDTLRRDALSGSAAALAADSAFAELSGGDLSAERLARDAERQRRKRAAAGA